MDIFWEILFQNLCNNSARPKQFTQQRFYNKQTVESEFFIHIFEMECWSRVIVIAY